MVLAIQSAEITPDFQAAIRLLARLARVAEQACQSTGISLPQYRLLVSISGQSQRASELATAVGVSRPTLTSLVDGLERGGLLRRAPVPSDRRGIQLIPTEAGRAAVGLAEAALAQRMRVLIDRDMAKVVGEALSMLDSALERDAAADLR
ncbi:MAG TPA: MarR family transcriptional regulator [Myxococcota bacterium]|jgi:DNA-binding MarR family transcriptional regulator